MYNRNLQKIKIAYVIDTISTDTAGSERQLLETIKRMNKNEYEISLICLYKSNWMCNNKIACKIYILDYKGLKRINIISVVMKLISCLRENDFNIIHTYFEESTILAYIAAYFCKKRPLLIAWRRDIGMESEKPWYYYFHDTVMSLIYKKYDGLTANCDAVKNYLVNIMKLRKDVIRVIHNGVDICEQELKCPEYVNKKNGDVWICIVANLKKVKRIDVFIRAFAIMSKQLCNVEVNAIIIGEGEEKEKLIKLATSLRVESKILFMGRIKDVKPYLKCSDIAVLSSDKEGLSNALLEYMSCSLPVVATKVGGNCEVINEDTGILVEAGDIDAMANALVQLVKNSELRNNLGKSGSERVKYRYSWKSSINSIETYYKMILANRAQ